MLVVVDERLRVEIARAHIDAGAGVAAVRAFALGRGASEAAALEVSEALAGMVHWVLTTAYEDHRGPLTVIARAEEDGVHLEVHDVGRPLPSFGGPDDPPPPELSPLAARVSDLRLRNLGKGGKRLACWVPCKGLRAADDQVAEARPDFDPETLVFRVAKADDAVAVGGLMHANYGLAYAHAEFYKPDRLAEAWESGRLLSVVGLDGDRVVAHTAFLRSASSECVEAGALVVHPAYRDRGVALFANMALFGMLPDLPAPAVAAWLTTRHTHSQSTALRSGFVPTGLLLGICPIGSDGNEGQFAILCAHLPLEQRPRPVALPSRYAGELAEVYRQMGQPLVEQDVPQAVREVGDAPGVDVSIGSESSPGTITVRRWSDEDRQHLLDGMREVVRGPAPMNYTDLDLHTLTADEIDEIVDVLRVYDHFVSALVPFGAYGHDYFRMQAILSGEVDLDDMALATEEAMRLRRMIYADHDQLSRRDVAGP